MQAARCKRTFIHSRRRIALDAHLKHEDKREAVSLCMHFHLISPTARHPPSLVVSCSPYLAASVDTVPPGSARAVRENKY